MDKLRIGIIFGGLSSEREVSLNSGRNVFDNLDRERYVPVPLFMDGEGRFWLIPWQLISQNTTVDIAEQLPRAAKQVSYQGLATEMDFAFLALHGKYGDDGCIQGLLELLNIPYTGSGVLGSALGMDKHVQQLILKNSGIAVPESRLVTKEEWHSRREESLNMLLDAFTFPLFTKPTREGSSVGVTMATDRETLASGIEAALLWDNAALVEEYIEGLEFSSILIEEEGIVRSLGITEIIPQSRYYTYDDKYMPGRCRKFTPPRHFSPSVVEEIGSTVIRAFAALGFRSYGRIDGFVAKGGRIMITDPNSSSGMAPSSFFFEQAACAGMLPGSIISRLIDSALSIHGKKKGPL